jgi:hypothetical protein
MFGSLVSLVGQDVTTLLAFSAVGIFILAGYVIYVIYRVARLRRDMPVRHPERDASRENMTTREHESGAHVDKYTPSRARTRTVVNTYSSTAGNVNVVPKSGVVRGAQSITRTRTVQGVARTRTVSTSAHKSRQRK